MACGDEQARFRAVVLDPALAATAPRRTAAAAGLDAVSHALESAVTTAGNPVSRMLAREAWRLLEGALPAALAAPEDLGAVGRALLGAHLAGAAIEQSMLGAAHACANPLTARFGVVHGAAVALMLPHVVRFNAAAAAEGYAELAAAAGLPGAPAGAGPAEALARRVEALRAAAGLPGRLADCGVPARALPALAAEATGQWTGRFNPRPATEADFLRLYEAAS
jgi:alcohol dehydrogenase